MWVRSRETSHSILLNNSCVFEKTSGSGDYVKKLEKEKLIKPDELTTLVKYLDPNGDMILYSQVFKKLPVDNTTFLDNFRNSCKEFTEFDSDKINFAIIKTKGKYDLKPKLKF